MQRVAKSQNDIDESRPPGSSCCTLFCSRLALKALEFRLPASSFPPSLTMAALQTLLLQAVRDWDKTGLVDGAAAHTVLAGCCEKQKNMDVQVLMQERFVSRADLQDILSESGNIGVLVTAIPQASSSEILQQRCGKTFVILSLTGAIYLVDSHAHDSVPAGMLRASVKGTQFADRAKVMCDWIWSDRGLLVEINCNRDLVVDITVIKNPNPRPQASAESVAASQSATSSQAVASQGATGRSGHVPIASQGASVRQDAASRQSGGMPMKAMACCTGDHEKNHPKFVKDCVECRWRHNGPKWQRLTSFHHPVTGVLVTPIVEKPPELRDFFAIGCSLCANYVNKMGCKGNSFAQFEVCSLATLQAQEMMRHCKGELHVKAMADLSSGLQPENTQTPDDTGVSTSGQEGVPRPEKFVWAVTTCHAAGSWRDYRKFCETMDLTSYLSSGSQVTDSSRQTCMKLTMAWGAVLQDQHQALLRKSQRLAFSIDERDQEFVNRVRVVVCNPKVQAHEFLAPIVRDYGHGIVECADAAWESLKGLCVKRVGRRERGGVTGPKDVLDEKLLQRLQDITFAGASDGAEVAIQGIQKLRLSARLPKLRYQFRDRPHTTRTCVKNVLSYMGEGTALLEGLVSGKESFCKRVKYSRRFQQLWKKRQREDLDEFMGVCENLAYKECRFDHRLVL